jgi:hypothetical protein
MRRRMGADVQYGSFKLFVCNYFSHATMACQMLFGSQDMYAGL